MLELKPDGYVYISDKGIKYDLLEGISIGANPVYTSNIIFIMLNNAEYNVDNPVVGYLFGTDIFERNPNSYEESIKELVDEFEKRNFGINPILEAIKEKMEMGYNKEQLEVDFGEIDDSEGYYLSKINGWGNTPITPILAAVGDFENKDLIAELDQLGMFYKL